MDNEGKVISVDRRTIVVRGSVRPSPSVAAGKSTTVAEVVAARGAIFGGANIYPISQQNPISKSGKSMPTEHTVSDDELIFCDGCRKEIKTPHKADTCEGFVFCANNFQCRQHLRATIIMFKQKRENVKKKVS